MTFLRFSSIFVDLFIITMWKMRWTPFYFLKFSPTCNLFLYCSCCSLWSTIFFRLKQVGRTLPLLLGYTMISFSLKFDNLHHYGTFSPISHTFKKWEAPPPLKNWETLSSATPFFPPSITALTTCISSVTEVSFSLSKIIRQLYKESVFLPSIKNMYN